MLTLARARMLDIAGEVAPLTIEHFNEISPFTGLGLKPDIAGYCALEDQDALRVYTVRDGPQLVGYSTFILFRNPHSQDSLQAHHDALFVLPEYRQQAAGARLLAFSESQLRDDGVDVVYQSVSTKCDVSPLLLAMKYTLINHTFAKQLRPA